VLDLVFRKFNREDFLVLVDVAKSVRRDQHEATAEPETGIHHQVADGPRIVVEVKIFDVSDMSVGGGDFVAVSFLGYDS
jgi:hypothetical protein